MHASFIGQKSIFALTNTLNLQCCVQLDLRLDYFQFNWTIIHGKKGGARISTSERLILKLVLSCEATHLRFVDVV